MAEPAMVADSEAIPLCLHWQQTWPDREADYVAYADGYNGEVGRIYLYEAGPREGLWFWAMNAQGREISRDIGELHGAEQSARAAARMVENAWFASIKGFSPDKPAVKGNAYALGEGKGVTTRDEARRTYPQWPMFQKAHETCSRNDRM